MHLRLAGFLLLALTACVAGAPSRSASSPGGALAANDPRSDTPSRGPSSAPLHAHAAHAEPLTFVPQIPHSAPVHAVIGTRDGQRVFSAGEDATIKLWEAPTGLLLRTYAPGSASIFDLALSPDGKRLLAGDTDHDASLIDVETGAVLRKLRATRLPGVLSVAFSPDGKKLLTGSDVVETWDAETGARLALFEGHAGGVLGVAFSPDGRLVVSADRHGLVLVRDAASGKVVRAMGTKKEGTSSVAFSPDTRWAVTGGWEKGIHIFDTTTGAETVTLAGHDRNIEGLALSPDGALVASGSSAEIKIWDLTTGKELHDIGDHEYKRRYQALAFTADGKTLLSGNILRTVEGWDVATGARVQRFAGRDWRATTVAFTPDHRLVIGATDNTVSLWDLETISRTRVMRGHDWWINSVAVSPDGKWAASGAQDHRAILWNLATGAKKNLGEHDDDVRHVAFSPDSRWVASCGRIDNSMTLFDVVTGSARKIKQKPERAASMSMFSPDGSKLLMHAGGSAVEVWDVATTTKLRDFETGSIHTVGFSFSRDAKRALSVDTMPTNVDDDVRLRLFDVDRGTVLRTLDLHARGVTSTAFLPDGTHALVLRLKNLELWDLEAGQRLRVFEGTQRAFGLSVSPDGRYATAISTDGTTRVWRIETGDAIAIAAEGSEWLVFDDEGHFDASRRGGELVAAVRGTHAFRVDQLAIRNNRPDLILRKMGFGSAEAVSHFRARHDRRLERLGLREEDVASAFDHAPTALITNVTESGNTADVTIELGDDEGDLARYNVFVNDVPLFGAEGKAISGKTHRAVERIELLNGANKIEANALDANGVESLRPLRTVTYVPKVQGALHFVGFGVSRYANHAYDLAYPHKDVLDLAELLKRERATFSEVHVTTFVNEEVTVANVKRAKEALRAAKAEDTVIVLVAGHGVHAHDAAATYYFATHELDVKRLAETAANFELIEELVVGIAPRRKLVLLDTCESGDHEEDDATRLPPERGLRARSIRALALDSRPATPARPRTFIFDRDRYIYNDLSRRSGAIVFASSRGSEESFESDELKNGVFTRQILEALTSRKADKDRDGVVSTDELKDFVSAAVARATDDKQHPTVDHDNVDIRFGFGIVEDARPVLARADPLEGATLTARSLNPRDTAAGDVPAGPPATNTPPKQPMPTGCGCKVVRAPPTNAALGAAGAGLVVLALGRRRRQLAQRTRGLSNAPRGTSAQRHAGSDEL